LALGEALVVGVRLAEAGSREVLRAAIPFRTANPDAGRAGPDAVECKL
jgi:hypothetical protein